MENNLVENVTTKQELIASFKKMGLTSDDTIIVHTALSKFYYIPGASLQLLKKQ